MRVEGQRTIQAARASELLQAPPSFALGDGRAVFADIAKAHASMSFDVAATRAEAVATVTFDLEEGGYPVMDLVPQPTRVVIDGRVVPAERYREIVPPGAQAPLRVLEEKLGPGRHTLEVTYTPSDAYFRNGGPGFRFRMSDMDSRRYLEKYVPCSMEYDQFPLTLDVSVSGAAHPMRLVANGKVEEREGGYHVEFPAYFTTSSAYVDLFDPAEFTILEDRYDGIEKRVPLTIYAPTAERAAQGMDIAKKTLAELEATYGPYAHGLFLALIGAEWAGGMEHAGATRSSLSALPHEITHSYFARGVMPANGNAGWIDEAIARWRDRGYPRADGIRHGSRYAPLAGFSPYRRHSPLESYEQGSEVMSELDWMLRDRGGLRPLLRELYARYERETITTPLFLAFVSERVGTDLRSYFDEKIYARPVAGAARAAA